MWRRGQTVEITNPGRSCNNSIFYDMTFMAALRERLPSKVAKIDHTARWQDDDWSSLQGELATFVMSLPSSVTWQLLNVLYIDRLDRYVVMLPESFERPSKEFNCVRCFRVRKPGEWKCWWCGTP